MLIMLHVQWSSYGNSNTNIETLSALISYQADIRVFEICLQISLLHVKFILTNVSGAFLTQFLYP